MSEVIAKSRFFEIGRLLAECKTIDDQKNYFNLLAQQINELIKELSHTPHDSHKEAAIRVCIYYMSAFLKWGLEQTAKNIKIDPEMIDDKVLIRPDLKDLLCQTLQEYGQRNAQRSDFFKPKTLAPTDLRRDESTSHHQKK